MTDRAMPTQAFVYPARAERVIDGDTLDVVLDLGLHLTTTQRVRLLDAWAPEVRGPERPLGLAAAGFVSHWVGTHNHAEWPLLVATEKDDAFGRWLGMVWARVSGECLNEAIVAAGHATKTKEKP